MRRAIELAIVAAVCGALAGAGTAWVVTSRQQAQGVCVEATYSGVGTTMVVNDVSSAWDTSGVISCPHGTYVQVHAVPMPGR
jgi:hypothetical protein